MNALTPSQPLWKDVGDMLSFVASIMIAALSGAAFFIPNTPVEVTLFFAGTLATGTIMTIVQIRSWGRRFNQR